MTHADLTTQRPYQLSCRLESLNNGWPERYRVGLRGLDLIGEEGKAGHAYYATTSA